MIVVTGAYGFIASCLVKHLNDMGHRNIVVVDDFYQDKKEPNLVGKAVHEWIHRDIFLQWFAKNAKYVDAVYHLGARTDTTSKDVAVFDMLNLEYSKQIWTICTETGIPLVYASSAATYGEGEHGYDDDEKKIPELRPMNAYAVSKQQFDEWVLKQEKQPPRWAGLKFFNVYGPNEYHKKRMASVAWHGYHQIKDTGMLKLFQSHREGIDDGQQKRDFIYVRDVIDICAYMMESEAPSGIYNVGTGQARSFLDLGTAIFSAMDLEPVIEFIPTPENIRDTYQYFTEAEMSKLRSAGYDKPFTPLEEGVEEYVKEYLLPARFF